VVVIAVLTLDSSGRTLLR